MDLEGLTGLHGLVASLEFNMKYLNSYISYLHQSPKDQKREAYQKAVDELFYRSSDWYTIQEETEYASGEFCEIDVRINNVVFGRTGLPQGDDHKVLLFKEIDHSVSLGWYYIFDDNYWIVTNVMSKSSLHTSAVVRRCNNVLKWVTQDGAVFEVPCAIDYGINENRDYSTAGSKLVSPSGMLRIFSQLNSKTNTIVANQRFLFGNVNNWTAFRVMGGGIENFNNLSTLTNDVSGLLTLTLNADYVNPDTDDLVNGIAEYNDNLYSIVLSDETLSGNPSDQIQLYATVTLNGQTVTKSLSWSSSNTKIATVDSNGLVTFVSEGNATITCSISDNAYINDTCAVTVTLAPVNEYQVVVSPNQNYVLETDTKTFTVELYLNGALQADAFSFILNAGTVPSDNYVFTAIDGNNFSIKNIEKYLDDTLVVQCTSGIHIKNIEIELRGIW